MSHVPPRLLRRDSFLGLHFDLHPQKTDTSLGADIAEEMIAELLRRVHPDYVQYDCKGHAGYTGYPTDVGWSSPGIVKDSLAIWRKVTREFGVALFIHYSGVWDSVAVEQRPEWAREDAQGNPDKNATSTFGPYVDELLIPQLKEVADAYDLDGVWVDGDCWAVQVDFGEAACAAFSEATGITAIPKSRQDTGWAELLDFQRDRFRRYVKHYADALHIHKPGFQVASNWFYSTLAPERPTLPLDFVSGDFSPGDSVNTARLEARYIASTGLPWDLMAWGFNKGDDAAWSHKPAVQLKQEAASVLSQGGGFQTYYQPTRAGWIDDWLVDVMEDVAAFCRERQDVSHKTASVPQVALLLPAEAIYASSDRLFGPFGVALNPVHGLLHALLELHYSVDVMAEWRLVDAIWNYPAVVLPETTAIGDDLKSELRSYALAGGNVVLVGAALCGQFADELGIEPVGEPKERSTFVRGDRSLASLTGLWQGVVPLSAEPVGVRFETTDTRKASFCASTTNRLGSGSVSGVLGPLGTAFHRTHYPAVREFLGCLMAHAYTSPAVSVDAAPTVEVSLRKRGGALLVHLTNLAGMQTASRYALIDSVPSPGPVVLGIPLEQRPQSVSVVPDDVPISHEWHDGTLRIEIPTFDIHCVVVVE